MSVFGSMQRSGLGKSPLVWERTAAVCSELVLRVG